MEATQPRICIQPQSRRSPRYYITIVIRAPSRVFQLKGSQHSFQDCMDYILPGLYRKHSITPCPRHHHCSLHRYGCSLYIGKSSFFFFFFWQKIRIFFRAHAVEEALRKDIDCPAEKKTLKKENGRGQASDSRKFCQNFAEILLTSDDFIFFGILPILKMQF